MASPESGLVAEPNHEKRIKELEQLLAEKDRELTKTKEKLTQAEADVRIDHLTGLRNRKALDEELTQRLGQFRREGRDGGTTEPMSLLIVDIDRFKNINDTQGHQAGDEILMTFAAVLQETARSGDTVARYGGEEFAVVLYGDNQDEAVQAAERFKDKINTHEFLYQKKRVSITASIGVASVIDSSQAEKDLLIKRADKALYAAKENGRDRVEVDKV